MKTLDKILLCVALFLALFIGLMCLTFWKFQAVPDTLITAVLGVGGLESIATAVITITKIVRNKNKGDE